MSKLYFNFDIREKTGWDFCFYTFRYSGTKSGWYLTCRKTLGSSSSILSVSSSVTLWSIKGQRSPSILLSGLPWVITILMSHFHLSVLWRTAHRGCKPASRGLHSFCPLTVRDETLLLLYGTSSTRPFASLVSVLAETHIPGHFSRGQWFNRQNSECSHSKKMLVSVDAKQSSKSYYQMAMDD